MSHNLEVAIDNFYRNDSGLLVPHYHRPPNAAAASFELSEPLVPEEWVQEEDVLEKIKEIAMNRQVLEYGDDSFDISTVTDNDPKKPYMIHMSTYGSSLDNAGNAWEFAVQCLQYPEFNHVYVASFANGASSAIPERDGQRQLAQETGRLTVTREDGQVVPMGIIQNLHRGLATKNINTIRVMGADSAGVSASRALALAMEPGQLESAVFSGATGMRDMNLPTIGMAMVKEQLINSRQNAKLAETYKTEATTPAKVAKAEAIMEQYTDPSMAAKINSRRLGLRAVVASRLVSGQSLKRGPSERGDPLVVETNAIAQIHNAVMWYIMGTRDPLYGGSEAAYKQAERYILAVDSSGMDLGVIMAPEMSHAYHTHFPELKVALAKAALRISGQRRRLS